MRSSVVATSALYPISSMVAIRLGTVQVSLCITVPLFPRRSMLTSFTPVMVVRPLISAVEHDAQVMPEIERVVRTNPADDEEGAAVFVTSVEPIVASRHAVQCLRCSCCIFSSCRGIFSFPSQYASENQLGRSSCWIPLSPSNNRKPPPSRSVLFTSVTTLSTVIDCRRRTEARVVSTENVALLSRRDMESRCISGNGARNAVIAAIQLRQWAFLMKNVTVDSGGLLFVIVSGMDGNNLGMWMISNSTDPRLIL